MKKNLIILISLIIFVSLIIIGYLYNSTKETPNTGINSNINLYEIEYFNPVHSDYYYGNDFSFYNNIYYKVITDYKEYLTYKNYYQEIIFMAEKDFNTNFIVLTITENESTKNLEFQNINSDDTTLYIGLDKSTNNPKRGISIKIDKSLLRENIDVYKSIQEENFITTYKNIKSIDKNYTIEQATNDNCFIILPTTVENKSVWNTFINNITNNEDAEIRIVYDISINEGLTILDIKYMNYQNKYYVCRDTSRNTGYESNLNYFEYDNFEKEDLNKVDLINSEKIENYLFSSNNFPETNFSISFYSNK